MWSHIAILKRVTMLPSIVSVIQVLTRADTLSAASHDVAGSLCDRSTFLNIAQQPPS